jgi:hypothetical protein
MPKIHTIEICENFCASWQASGLTKKKFCEENKISQSALYRWLKKFDESQAVTTPKSPQTIKFLPINQKHELQKHAEVEVTLPNGILLKFEVSSIGALIMELSK